MALPQIISINEPILTVFAFAAGAATFFNPCGIALLPMYVSQYIARKDKGTYLEAKDVLPVGIMRGALIGFAATLGFLVLFGLFGLLLSYVGSLISNAMPSIALILGLILMGIGTTVLLKVPIHLNIPFVTKIRPQSKQGFSSYFTFGIAYGLASLSCTIPVFLLVVLAALSTGGFIASLAIYLAYAAGMGALMISLSVGMVASKKFSNNYLKLVRPHMHKINGSLIIAAGLYVIYIQYLGGPFPMIPQP